MNYPLTGRWPRPSPLATCGDRGKGLDRKLYRAVARRHDDQKGGRDLAPSRCGRAAGGEGRSAADYAVFYSPIVAESDQWSVRRIDRLATREGRDHRPNRTSEFKSVSRTRFAVRDKEGAPCRSGCQRG